MNHSPALEVGLATLADIDGILLVQEQNQPENGGSLSARFSAEWFTQAIENEWIIVARSGDAIAGYVAFTPRAAQEHIPIIQAMLRSGPNPLAYLHGPICVATEHRRRGVASELFAAQRAHMNQAAVCTFIREDNLASRQAHLRMGLVETLRFDHDGVRYVVQESINE